MEDNKTSRTVENSYLTALLYGGLLVVILILRNRDYTDRFVLLYALSTLGMTLLFLSFPYSIQGLKSYSPRLGTALRTASLLCFIATVVWLISITFAWYDDQLNFQFHLGGLLIYLVGLFLSFLILFARISKFSKELRQNVRKVNSSAIRNFITASLILAYLQLSLLFQIDFLTHLVGLLAFAIILIDQSVNITRWFMTDRHVHQA